MMKMRSSNFPLGCLLDGIYCTSTILLLVMIYSITFAPADCSAIEFIGSLLVTRETIAVNITQGKAHD